MTDQPRHFLRRHEASSHPHDPWGNSLTAKTLARLAVIGGGSATGRCSKLFTCSTKIEAKGGGLSGRWLMSGLAPALTIASTEIWLEYQATAR